MKKSSVKLSVGAAALLIALGIAIAANVLASQLHFRVDFTKDKLYTLSDGTKKLLTSLDRDVTLKFYFSRSLQGMPEQLKQFAQRIQDLLSEYARVSGGKVALEVIDPKPDSDEEERAQREGLQGQNIDPFGQSQFYLGLSMKSGAKESSIPMFSPQGEERLEYDITKRLLEVTEAKKPHIGLMASLPVSGAPTMNPFGGQQGGQEPWTFYTELQGQYDIEDVAPSVTEVPTNIDTLVVIHPKQASDDLLFALDQFVMRGGHLIAFVDPLCISDQSSQMGGMMGMGGGQNVSDLNRLTKPWGIEMDTASVVSDGQAATRIRGMGGRPQRSTSWLSLRGVNMNKNEISVGALGSVMLPFAGAFKGKPVDGLKMDVLMQSSPGATTMSSMEAQMGGESPMAVATEKSDKPLALAIRLTGKFKTAFPDGKPQAEGAASNATKTVALKESTKNGAVVLVGDCDMLNDNFAVEKVNFFGQQAVQLMNDNIPLVNNLVEQNSGSEILIGLRSRGSFRRPFDKVIALEDSASQQWRDEEQKLNTKMQDLQMKLSELQRTKNKEQQLVLSPEQRREIEKFRAQQTDTKRQLKDVRKSLRQDIEKLGLKLKILNIAAVPLSVAIFGIVFAAVRRKKALT